MLLTDVSIQDQDISKLLRVQYLDVLVVRVMVVHHIVDVVLHQSPVGSGPVAVHRGSAAKSW